MKKLFAVAALLLSGCAVYNNTGDFRGRTYKLVNAPNNAEITIAFDAKDPRFAGSAAVNRYFGSYRLKPEGGMEFSPAGTTMMMGPMSLMQAEEEYLKILPTVSGYDLKGQTLILKTSGAHDLIFMETVPDRDN